MQLTIGTKQPEETCCTTYPTFIATILKTLKKYKRLTQVQIDMRSQKRCSCINGMYKTITAVGLMQVYRSKDIKYNDVIKPYVLDALQSAFRLG